MNKSYTVLFLLILSFNAFSQNPRAFKYQAILRDTSGNVIPNQNVSLIVGLLEGRMDGTEVFSELHQTETNNFGLIDVEIGNGNNLYGSLDGLVWGDSIYFMRIELDETGGSNYQLMGISQILSVPIALYARESGDTSRWRQDSVNVYYNKGNVGIGTKNPVDLLHLYKECALDTDNAGLRFSNPLVNGNSWFIGIKSNIDPAGFSILSDYTGNNPALFIGKAGKIGIGTENPEYSLQVEGNSVINGNLGINKVNPEYALDMGGDIRIKDLMIGDSSSSNTKFNIIGSNHVDAAKIEIGKGQDESSKSLKFITRAGGSIQFFTETKIRMQIRDSAVVIGRPTPDKFVDLLVNGNVKTRQIEVEIDEWWDNVFSPDYKLPSLEEVENYIAENNHLPGIPSGETILSQGMNVGEMNGLLLKKIEELTLYVLELKKENEQLALEIDNLKITK
ncbi:MAG: hypothetical protein JW731_12820 [Bacteroidales bacterium]|nr:hypothetical protein [Bacteroidales bacterium]